MISRDQLQQLAKALGGIPILGCLEGSPVQKAGIQYGDVLLTLNDQKVGSASEYVEAKSLRQGGMSGTFFRGGQTLSFDITYVEGAVADPASLVPELMAKRIIDEQDFKAPVASTSQAN